MGSPDGELSILIVDDDRIAELNHTYLHRHGPTNVIAFPMREGDFGDITPSLLGDVVVSADTAAREARLADVAMTVRLTELLVHGILHLFGFDHETGPEDERVMEEKSRQLLDRLLSEDPQ